MTKQTGRVVVFDFDNTITTYDVLDDIILRFSVNDAWKALEDKWKRGKIGSKECLKGQMAGIRITKENLDRYLKKIKLDPYFKKLIRLLGANKIRMMILSDDFDYILKAVLKNHGVSGIPIYSNSLKVAGDRLITKFPFTDKACGICGHCKTGSILSKIDRKISVIYYIGDGASDICPAKHSEIVFAKGHLAEHLSKIGVRHIPIKGLKETYRYFYKLFS